MCELQHTPPTDWRFCVRHRTLASVQFKHWRHSPPGYRDCFFLMQVPGTGIFFFFHHSPGYRDFFQIYPPIRTEVKALCGNLPIWVLHPIRTQLKSRYPGFFHICPPPIRALGASAQCPWRHSRVPFFFFLMKVPGTGIFLGGKKPPSGP